MFELFGKKPAGKLNPKTRVHASDKTCRVMTDLLDPDGDAVDSWRVFRIMSEFVLGFDLLRKYRLAATVFGGARFVEGDPYYEDAKELSALLAKRGFTVITGGGPGIMEAANTGAYNAGGKSVGLNIQLPTEQKLNPFVTENASFDFFFSRKVMLAYASEVYIFFPGGFGTLDEFFEMVTLVQTGKIECIPIILYGKEFWEPMLDWVGHKMLKQYKTVSKEDLNIFQLADSLDEVMAIIERKVPSNKFTRIEHAA
ncbi:MAG: TIGR00730 family Rossman fold protein [Candidatus Paceibacterota bacterium]